MLGDEEAVECISCTILMVWGFWLMIPFLNTFDAMTSYRPLVAYGIPEGLVGLVVFLLGVARLYLVLSVRFRPRQSLAAITGAFWGFNLFLALTANTASLLVPIYAMNIFIAMWTAFRLNGRIRSA